MGESEQEKNQISVLQKIRSEGTNDGGTNEQNLTAETPSALPAACYCLNTGGSDLWMAGCSSEKERSTTAHVSRQSHHALPDCCSATFIQLPGGAGARPRPAACCHKPGARRSSLHVLSRSARTPALLWCADAGGSSGCGSSVAVRLPASRSGPRGLTCEHHRRSSRAPAEDWLLLPHHRRRPGPIFIPQKRGLPITQKARAVDELFPQNNVKSGEPAGNNRWEGNYVGDPPQKRKEKKCTRKECVTLSCDAPKQRLPFATSAHNHLKNFISRVRESSSTRGRLLNADSCMGAAAGEFRESYRSESSAERQQASKTWSAIDSRVPLAGQRPATAARENICAAYHVV